MNAPLLSRTDSLRVIWSPSLVQGFGAGFAFILRGDRIAGAKKFTQEDYIVDLGTVADPAERARAMKVLEGLEKGIRFELTRDQIVGIEFAEPGRFGPGRITFRTIRGEQTVKITGSFGTGSGAILRVLLSTFESFAPGKVRKVG